MTMKLTRAKMKAFADMPDQYKCCEESIRVYTRVAGRELQGFGIPETWIPKCLGCGAVLKEVALFRFFGEDDAEVVAVDLIDIDEGRL